MQESINSGNLNHESVTADRARFCLTAAVRGTAVVFVADRVTKLIFSSFAIPSIISPIPRLITFVQHENQGIIANIPVPQYLIIAATIGVLILVGHALFTSIRAGRVYAAVALGVLMGGAFGNLYDRVTLGYVFDWILLFGRSAVNLADAAIVLGAVGYFAALRKEDARSA